MNVPHPITGHCLCGAVSYEIDAEPMTVALCHCEDCRRQSGAPFSLNLGVDRDALKLDFSKTKTFITVGADSGEERERVFCPECGSPILSILNEASDIAFIKAGTLDDASWLEPELEVFTESAQPWFHDENAPERGLFPRSLPT
jgi:hypothetical protein